MKSSRRHFLQWSSIAAVGGLVASKTQAAPAPACVGATPAQTEGPFYPVTHQPDEDVDLTLVRGHQQAAQGQVVFIHGVVADNCQPIAGAMVEIWQACHSGKYNHPNDPNTAALDPNFQYWGRAVTDAQGRYTFKTIIPGAYPAGAGWVRPPHVHFKVTKLGYKDLTTQMYFAGQALNARDQILLSLKPEDRRKVVVNFEKAPSTAPYSAGSLRGFFPIALERVRF